MGYSRKVLEYKVVVETDFDTGVILRETWYNSHGLEDRPGDLPAVIDYRETGDGIASMKWMKNGRLHRSGDKPASVTYDNQSHGLTREAYFTYGAWTRENDKPAILCWSPEGKLERQEYKLDGQLHRTGGPAVEVFDPDSGVLIEAEFWSYGERYDCDEKVIPSP